MHGNIKSKQEQRQLSTEYLSNFCIHHSSKTANYRPVSMTCVICKVLESFMRDHVMEHFKTNNLFTDNQYRFIKGRSTYLELLSVLDIWTKDLEDEGQIDVIYTVFDKAFDKVPLRHLISKLKSYGIFLASIYG